MVAATMSLVLTTLLAGAALDTGAARAAATAPTETPTRSEQEAELARLHAEIERLRALRNQGPRRLFLSTSHKGDFADYMQEYVRRVEERGAQVIAERPEFVSGTIIVTVAIRRDGSIEEIVINGNDGGPSLAALAREIVTLAAPFPPLPSGSDYDVVHVTRTFQFVAGDDRDD